MRTRAFAAVSTALLVLLLTACAASPADPSPPPSPSVTPSATKSPAAAPSVSPSPSEVPAALDCPPWTDGPGTGASAIDVNRYAGACLGMTFDEATANGTPTVGEEQCPWYAPIVSDDELGFYIIAVTQDADAAGTISFFILRWFSDPTGAADADVPATPEGITIGSTADEVLAAYPAAQEITFDDMARGPRTQLVVPTGDSTSYNFDITDLRVSEISWGEDLGTGGPRGDLCAL